MLSVFRTGVPLDALDRRYDPLTSQPIEQTVLDPNVNTDALGFLAVAVSLLGRGVAEALWTLEPGDSQTPRKGVFTLDGASGSLRVFLVQDSGALAQLEGQGHIDMSDSSVLTIHAKTIPPQQTRSPRSRYGRTGKQPAKEVAIESMVKDEPDFQALMSAFHKEVAS